MAVLPQANTNSMTQNRVWFFFFFEILLLQNINLSLNMETKTAFSYIKCTLIAEI